MDKSYKNDPSYIEEYYHEVYLPYMLELYENCSDDDFYEETSKEPTKKEMNKSNRKEIINEALNDFPCTEVLDEKGKSRLSLKPKAYVKKELGNYKNKNSRSCKTSKSVPSGKGKYYTSHR